MNSVVSVILPVFNGEKYIAQAIESVMAQSYRPLELIIVDDGSTDNTAVIVKRFSSSVRYLFMNNAGTGAARNHGVQSAQGDFFAFVDADDLWIADKLTMQMNVFNDNPEIEAVFGHVKQFFSPDLDEESRSRLFCPDELIAGYLPYTMLIRRSSFLRVGFFEEHWHVGQDVSWILQARALDIKTMMLPDLVYMRRLHKNNKGITHRRFINDRVRIIKNHLDARRKNNI